MGGALTVLYSKCITHIISAHFYVVLIPYIRGACAYYQHVYIRILPR